MTVVMALFTPAIALTSAWMGRMTASRTQVEQDKYAIAGAIAEETLSSMRTIHSLNAEQQELERFGKFLGKNFCSKQNLKISISLKIQSHPFFKNNCF